jgi:hypothetical protein
LPPLPRRGDNPSVAVERAVIAVAAAGMVGEEEVVRAVEAKVEAAVVATAAAAAVIVAVVAATVTAAAAAVVVTAAAAAISAVATAVFAAAARHECATVAMPLAGSVGRATSRQRASSWPTTWAVRGCF